MHTIHTRAPETGEPLTLRLDGDVLEVFVGGASQGRFDVYGIRGVTIGNDRRGDVEIVVTLAHGTSTVSLPAEARPEALALVAGVETAREQW